MPINHDTSFLQNMPANVAVQFRDRVAATPEREAFRFPRGDAWESMSWGQAGELVESLAAGLVALGIEPEQRVGISSGTRYEWILADLAVMCAAGATTTVYPTTNGEDTTYILGDSESRVVFAEDDIQIKKLRDNKAELPDVSKVVTFAGTTDGDWVIGLDDLAALGKARLAQDPDLIAALVKTIKPEQLATLIYTSGTTGRPKGVRLRHVSWVYEGEAVKAQGILSKDDLQFLWLPMAHSFGKVLLCSQLACGFPTAVDGRVEKIVDNLAVVQPTFMGAAPRIFEKAHGRIVTMQEAEGGAKEKIFKAAFATGLRSTSSSARARACRWASSSSTACSTSWSSARFATRFGGRVRFFISGAAALNREVAEWFNAAGIQILEGYGLTETSAGAFVNHPETNRFGTVGPAFPGSEVKIGENGEVLIKGPGVMEGYHNHPEETARTRR